MWHASEGIQDMVSHMILPPLWRNLNTTYVAGLGTAIGGLNTSGIVDILQGTGEIQDKVKEERRIRNAQEEHTC
jgi:hypothetical protein